MKNPFKREYFYSISYYLTANGNLTGMQTMFLANKTKLGFIEVLSSLMVIHPDSLPTIISLNPLSRKEFTLMSEVYNEIQSRLHTDSESEAISDSVSGEVSS